METQAIYGVKTTVSIRESCFLPVAEGWTAPTTDELETMLVMVRWKAGDLMRILGVTDRTVRRWLSGQTEIPFAAWCIMSYQAGYGEIWKGSGRGHDYSWMAGMSTRLRNNLVREGITSLDSLRQLFQEWAPAQWIALDNFGNKCYDELRVWLAEGVGDDHC